MPGIYEARWVTALDEQLVHLIVSRRRRFTVEAATLDDAEAFWEAHRPEVRRPVADLEVTRSRRFAELRAGDATAYGSKAANLGELTHVLAAPHRPDGFAIPFSHYRDFAASEPVAAEIDALLDAPRAAHRRGVQARRRSRTCAT